MARVDPLLRASPTVALALFLLCEAKLGAASFFAPYIGLLPAEHSTPLYFKPETIELLPPYMRDRAITGWRLAVKQYCYCCRLIAGRAARDAGFPLESSDFSFGAFRWALSTVITRQNLVPDPRSDTGRTELALIPFWDFANHQHGPLLTEWRLDQSTAAHGVQSSAMSLVPEGGQVFMCYGRRSNAEFLLYSGFVPAVNPDDSLDLILRFEVDEYFKLRKLILDKRGFAVTEVCTHTFDLKWSQCVGDARAALDLLLLPAQISCCSKEELAQLLRDSLDVFCAETCDRAASIVRQICAEAQRAYDCTLEALEEAGDDPAASSIRSYVQAQKCWCASLQTLLA
jgi:hypothetical protein